MDGGAEVDERAGEDVVGGRARAAEAIRSLDHVNGPTGRGELDGRSEPVRPGADDDGVVLGHGVFTNSSTAA